MSKGRFESLEFEEDPSGQGDKPGPTGSAPGGDRKHFVEEVRDAAYYLGKAEQSEMGGDAETALRRYSAALGENPLCLEAWVGQIRMLIELQEFPEARLWSDKALEKFPDHPEILAAKALALYRVGQRREGRALSDAALKAKGESEWVWICRGELMLSDNRLAGEECFKKALNVSNDRGVTLLRVGAIYLRYGKYSQALTALQDAASLLPRMAHAWYLLGCAQQRLGLLKQARTSFEQAAAIAPRSGAYHQAVASAKGGVRSKMIEGLRRLFGR